MPRAYTSRVLTGTRAFCHGAPGPEPAADFLFRGAEMPKSFWSRVKHSLFTGAVDSFHTGPPGPLWTVSTAPQQQAGHRERRFSGEGFSQAPAVPHGPSCRHLTLCVCLSNATVCGWVCSPGRYVGVRRPLLCTHVGRNGSANRDFGWRMSTDEQV